MAQLGAHPTRRNARRDQKAASGSECDRCRPTSRQVRTVRELGHKVRHGINESHSGTVRAPSSWHGLATPSTSLLLALRKDVDGRAKPGQDDWVVCCILVTASWPSKRDYVRAQLQRLGQQLQWWTSRWWCRSPTQASTTTGCSGR